MKGTQHQEEEDEKQKKGHQMDPSNKEHAAI